MAYSHVCFNHGILSVYLPNVMDVGTHKLFFIMPGLNCNKGVIQRQIEIYRDMAASHAQVSHNELNSKLSYRLML